MPKLTAVQVRKARQKDKPYKLSDGQRLFSMSLSDEVIRTLGVARSTYFKSRLTLFQKVIHQVATNSLVQSIMTDDNCQSN